MSEKSDSIWCYATQRMVKVKGKIVGRRVAEVLRIEDCDIQACPMRQSHDCLIEKEVEGRW